MRVGLFGGTFNPIHAGHLMAAEAVLQRIALDRLYFIPCRVPPHKLPAYLAPAADRFRMIRLALPPDARYRLSDAEMRRDGPSYTIDTVTHFAARIPAGTPMYLIMGMDAFLDMHTWKNRQGLLERVFPVVVSRRPEDGISTPDDAQQMDSYIRAQLPGDYVYDPQQTCWQRVDGNRILLLSTRPVDISSSQVRQRIRDGKAIDDLVPPPVKAYIDNKELYR
jgi:nicotinate-nucleotide adenylyltransferase